MEKAPIEVDDFIYALKKMSLDIPIESACLPKKIETILINNQILTIWDVVNTDVRLIKGIGKKSFDIITSHFGQFLTM